MHLAVSLQTLSLSDLGNRLVARVLLGRGREEEGDINNKIVLADYPNLVSSSDRSSMDEDLWLECGGDSGGCLPPPPPFFDIPPPPKPQLFRDYDEQDCQDNPSFSQILDQLETCDHTLILGPSAHFENAFHSVAVVFVCAIVLVMISMVAGVVLFKRRKTISSLLTDVGSRVPAAFSSSRSSPGHHSGGAGSSSSSQANIGQNFYHQQQLGMTCPAAPDSSVTLSTTASNSTPKKLFFYTMKRDSSAGDELDSRQYPNRDVSSSKNKNAGGFQGCHSLPNHYIQQEDHKVFQQQQHQSRDPRQQRLQLGEPGVSGHRMELASQPPLNPNPHIYHNFPHIIIGGQPFYLIPSDPELAATFGGEQENSYAYPQNVPIYEEILEDSFSVSSDQGEVGSLSRHHHHHATADDISKAAAALNLMEQQPSKARVLVNPLVRDLAFQDFRPIQPHREEHLVAMNSSSPSTSQTSSSIYYYSDTLKKPSAGSFQSCSGTSGCNNEQHSDSGFSNRSPCTKLPLGSSSSSSGSSLEAPPTRPSSSSAPAAATNRTAVETQVVVVLDDQDIVPLTNAKGKIKATTLV